MQTKTKSRSGTMAANEPDQSTAEPSTLDRNDVFHALQNSRRRGVVRYFEEFEGAVSIGDLADQVAAWECDTTVEEVTSDQRQRVYIALYQSHLTKLDDSDVIEYDERSGTISAGPNHDLLARHVSPVRDEPTDARGSSTEAEHRSTAPRWTGSYLGISLGGLVLVATAILGTAPGQWVPLDVLNITLLVSYLSVAILHWSDSR